MSAKCKCPVPLFAALACALSLCSAPGIAAPQTSTVPQSNPGRSSSAQAWVKAVISACGNPAPSDDANLAQNYPLMFGWYLFLRINCPAFPGPSTPVMWETWKPNYAVYQPGGKPPEPWGTLPPRKLLDQPEISGFTLLDKTGKPILNEIRLNKAAFQYVVQRRFYSKAAQLAFFNDPNGAPVQFPADSMEIKAAWLILTPGDPRNARYYTIQSLYVDPSGQAHRVLAGLTALHISSKVLHPNWFWTSFEQVDNQVRTQAPLTVPIPPNVQQLNKAVHDALPAGSVWRNYNMRGAMTAFTNADGSPAILANTQLETNFQLSSSCITCHNLATRGSETEGRLGFFLMTRTGVRGYTGAPGDAANKYFDAFQNPVCYDGSLGAFTNCEKPNPAIVYKRLDYVWSLREAN
jgi:hypothetical protein